MLQVCADLLVIEWWKRIGQGLIRGTINDDHLGLTGARGQ